MTKKTFKDLTLLCRTGACANGCAEVCRDPSGVRLIRLRIARTSLQRSLLRDRPADLPVRMQGCTLELLLPLAQGQTLREWLYFRHPDLGQRREVCLRLLAELLTHPVPAALLALSARTENLRLEEQAARLAWFPCLEGWKPGRDQGAAVQAVSRLAAEILTRGLAEGQRYRFPPELRLVLLRADAGAYDNWQALQQDLAALPDALEPRCRWLRTRAGPVRAWWQRFRAPVLRVVVGLLAAVALLSLAQTLQARQRRRQDSWPGMAQVGNQVLGKEDAIA